MKPLCVKVDSLQPTLQWESFPIHDDKIADNKELLSRIKNVAYDLRIWIVENDFQVELVYARQRLPDCTHKIEHILKPSTTYFWSVRASFQLDGKFRATKWSYSRLPNPPSVPDPCRLDYIPVSNYCCFISPQK